MSKRCTHQHSTVRTKRLSAHAEGRAYTRFDLPQHEVYAIRKKIQQYYENSCKPTPETPIKVLERQSNARSVVAVLWKGNWMPIVYDKKRKIIVSFLPATALEGIYPSNAAT